MNAIPIGSFHAKTHLSDLIDQVRHGRTFLITRRGVAVAELRPVTSGRKRARFGCDRGRVKIRGDFDAPIPGFRKYTR